MAARIVRLDEETVNRIAAGEILQRPASFVKEAIENSLDAGATSIGVSVKPSMIQVTDNGKGIHPDDLLLLSKRHSTSKLRAFDDLRAIATYGFRGEALASAMCVAQVTITTQPAGSPCAHRAVYRESKMQGKIAKTAGTPGTQVTVEDLFYNDPARLSALRPHAEEYARVLDVVQKYSIHHAGKVSFSCARAGKAPDVHTQSTASLKDVILGVYGADLARELLDVDVAALGHGCAVKGAVSNANYACKRADTVFFINERLVECAAVKRAVETLYAELLPKNSHAFAYLAFSMPREQVDVNTHPTKAQVAFLFETELCHALQEALREVLKSATQSRTFATVQTRLAVDAAGWVLSQQGARDAASNHDGGSDDDDDSSANESARATAASKPHASKRVRTDVSQEAGALDKYLVRVGCGHHHSDAHDDEPSAQRTATPPPPPPASQDELDSAPSIVPGSDALDLQSVRRLREEIASKSSGAANELLRNAVVVGTVDDRLSLVQSGNALLCVDHVALCRELMYQRAVQLFGRYLPVRVEPPLDVAALIGDELALKLTEHAAMLHEYFGVDIRTGRHLTALPRLLAGHVYEAAALPRLLRSVAIANWSDESACLSFVTRCIADASAELPRFVADADPLDRGSLQYALKHVVFPAVRSSARFLAPREFAEPSRAIIVQLATTRDLYKVFERC